MLNSEMDKLSIWFKANKPSLNLKKTKFMVFKPRQKRSICNIQISVDIVKVKEANFLGVILDENLNWKSEISHVANKVAKSIGISRCSFFLPKTSLCMLYYSLICPYFYYCNIVWASTYKTNLRRLVILQKRRIRLINKSHFNAHTDPIFKDLGIPKFNDIHLLQLGQFMYSCKNSFLPTRFNDHLSNSPKAINSTLTTQEIPRPTDYRIAVQTLRSSRPFFKGLSFLIHFVSLIKKALSLS